MYINAPQVQKRLVLPLLRSFGPYKPFRGLAAQPFSPSPEKNSLGKNTVIFGRNGSGKSTFSEYLRLLNSAEHPTGPLRGSYYDSALNKVRSGLVSSEIVDEVHVFNRFYVEASLGQFLDGEKHGSPIVVLGEDNVNAKREIGIHESEISRQSVRNKWAIEEARKSRAATKSVVESLKKDIVETLGPIDGSEFNSTRFNITKAENLLRKTDTQRVSTPVFHAMVGLAGEVDKADVRIPPFPDSNFRILFERIKELSLRKVSNVAIEALLSDVNLGVWVEQGLPLHLAGDSCKFCEAGTVSAERLSALGDHFSDALQRLRNDAREVLKELESKRESVLSDEWIPDSERFISTYEEKARGISRRWTNSLKTHDKWFQDATKVLAGIIADPIGHKQEVGQLQHLPQLHEIEDLRKLIQENNLACGEQSKQRTEALDSIQGHLSTSWRDLYEQAKHKESLCDGLQRATARVIKFHQEKVIAKRATLSNTSAMAALIDTDLSTVFGHDHLRVEVNADSTGYTITRRGRIAENLSEGERHSIALLYFLRTLERSGITPTDDIVVVDDPVTSLDRDALFAAHSLLSTRLNNFGQTILLTHDFELYRLAVAAKRSAFESSQKRIGEGDSKEINFPSVKFLEIIATRKYDSQDRESSLRCLPTTLLAHPSEYHYLFWCVANALASRDESIIPLLGNAGRRLLEGFISFKAPNGTTFQQKVDITTELTVSAGEHIPASLALVKERVVKFAHGTSHRAEPVPTTGLDFMAVRDELRKILQFIQLCDPVHFVRIAESVKIDLKTLNLEINQDQSSPDTKSLHVFGWIPSASHIAYAEVLRPHLAAYAVNLANGQLDDIAALNSTQHHGLWILASPQGEGFFAHVVRSASAIKLLRTSPPTRDWNFAYYLTGTGINSWEPKHLHYLETAIRRQPETFGITALEVGPVADELPSLPADVTEACEGVLDSIPLVIRTLSSLLSASGTLVKDA